MLTPPPTKWWKNSYHLYWSSTELLDCPYGTLVCAICPGEIPRTILQSLHTIEQTYAAALPGDRRREWLAGRFCLAAALARYSSERVPLLPLSSGKPTLPEGFMGSISHKGPLAVAVASPTASASLRGIGVDLEYMEPSDERLADRVLTPSERSNISIDLGAAVAVHFSIKEAIFKSLELSEQISVDFHDIEVKLQRDYLSCSGLWNSADVRIHGEKGSVKASVLFEERWVIAVARRE